MKLFYRDLFDVIKICDEGLPFIEKIGMDPLLITLWSLKANAKLILKDLVGAENSLNKAEEIFKDQQIVPPTYGSSYQTTCFEVRRIACRW